MCGFRHYFSVKSLNVLIALSFAIIFASPIEIEAQRRKPLRLKRAITNIEQDTNLQAAYDFDLSNQINTLFDSSLDTDIYDPMTIESLRRQKDDVQPYWENDQDYDPYESRKLVEKAAAIEFSNRFITLIKGSDLRPTFKAVKRQVNNFRETFKYSVQDSGEGYAVSKESKGEKLIELNLELDAKQGLDPQLRIGDNWRLRYDIFNDSSVLEFSKNY